MTIVNDMCVPIFWNLGKKPIQKLAAIFSWDKPYQTKETLKSKETELTSEQTETRTLKVEVLSRTFVVEKIVGWSSI